MIKREVFGLISNLRSFMAFSKIHLSAVSSCSYGLRRHDGCARIQKIDLVETRTSSPISVNKSRWKRSLNRNEDLPGRIDNGSAKTHAVAPPSQLFRASSMLLEEETGVNLLNGFGEPPGFPGRLNHEKMVVAVDIDEGMYLFTNLFFICVDYVLCC